jgi:HSP20 family molecular chaperone IbpA
MTTQLAAVMHRMNGTELIKHSSEEIFNQFSQMHDVIAHKRETKEEEGNGKMIRSEWCADRVFRTLDLPLDVDTSKVSSNLKDGILTVNLPKALSAREPKAA